MRIWQGICLKAALLVSFISVCHAQTSVTPEDEYKKLIKVDQTIEPLGAHPFGEQINLYDGTLSFDETDVSLPGNGPALQLGRSFQTAESPNYSFNAQRPFGDWELEIPRIETISADQQNVVGWKTSSLTNQRCSFFSAPPSVSPSQPGADPWGSSQWWYGYHLIVPGQGSQELLARDVQNNPLSPTISGQTFSIVTKQNWMISCGVLTDNQTSDPGGEGFVALAPDGTRYTFNHLVYRPMPDITSPLGTPPMGANAMKSIHPDVAPFNILYRRDALMYITQVQDRFGNTLTYDYDSATGYLSDIRSNDGREITLTYVSGSPRIQTVTAQASDAPTRSWTYNYDTSNPSMPNLTSVQLPDGSAWSYSLGLQTATIITEGGRCYDSSLPILESGSYTGTITHPSGLTATFTVTPTLRGRSYVPKQCWGDVASGSQAIYAIFPETNYQLSLTSETVSGPGLPTRTWTYSYSPSNQSWTTDACATAGTCPTTVYTDVVDPEGHDVRSTFSNRFDVSEGLLQRTDYFTSSNTSAVLRSEINTYANPVGGPWPISYGIDLQDRDNHAQTTKQSPLSLKQTLQDGDTYSWQAESFNAYTQVTQAKRFNSIGGQSALEESTSYLNDANLWVLGLPLQVTNVGTGEAESTNTYTTNDTLLTRARFGQQLMSYTFNSAGQLASFTDGNTNTTSLTNYKRGIPQSIGYPDSTTETLVVDDLGQIRSITDQATHTTGYQYDQGGRVKEIDYPTGDEQSWAPTYITTTTTGTPAERGLAAGHWKRATATGGATTVTYFDAMLRPVVSDSDLGSTVQSSTLTTYDSKGQKLFSSYPSAAALTFTQSPTVDGSTTAYDAIGRVTQVQQASELGALTTSTSYGSGASQAVTDPKGNVTTTHYQVFDSPSNDAVIQVEVKPSSSAPAVTTQTVVRDAYGNPQSITQFGPYGTGTDTLTKALFYDSFHRLCRTAEPESGSEVMHYDGANNLDWNASGLTTVSPTDTTCAYGNGQIAANQITRTYDAMNRLKTILPPAFTQSTTYGYDAAGRMTSAVSGISTWIGTYNFRGMLTGESLQLSGQSAWGIGYAHDANGSLTLIHYPDGENVSYAPDALGRPTQVGSYANGIGYWPNGQVSGLVFGNGTNYITDQNTRQLLKNFSYGPGATPQLSEDLTYDQDANITAVTDLTSGPRNKSFGYDALNRLTSATAAGLWGTQSFTYDALNNLRTLQTNGQTATYTYDTTNKLTGISGALTASYTYDSRGNVSNKNATALSFDQKNQLTNIGAETFAYDAAGRRVSKVNGGITTYYFYNQAGQLMYQSSPGSLSSTNYIYLGTKLVARDVNAAPTISSPASSATGNYTVSWTAFSGATSYNLQEQVNAGSWTTIQSGSATASAITGKNNGVYGYQVQACNAVTCTAWSNTTNTTVTLPPAAPATITVPATSTGSVAVSWAASATAASYTLQHRLGAGGWSNAYTGAGTSTSVNETSTGSYTYQVQACNAGGCSAFTLSSAVAVTLPVTSAPTLTTPAISSNGSYTVSWNTVAAASTYTLQEQINGGSWSTTQNSSATSQSFSGRAAATYGYRVQGCNVDGCGPFSSVANTAVVYPPSAPATINVPPTSTGSVAVSWTASATTTSYTLQHRLGAGGWSNAYSGASTSTGINETTTGSYTYQVEACNAGGCSAFTPSSAVAVTIPPSTAATMTVAATSYTGSYSVSWSAVGGATSYTLQEQVNGGAWATILTANVLSDALSNKSTASYGYRVQGCNVGGCGPWSATGTIAVTRIPAVPNTPSLTVTYTAQKGTVHASWAAVAFATSYHVEETSPDGSTTVTDVTTTTASQYVPQSGTVKYRVEACNVAGCSTYSGYGTTTVQGGLGGESAPAESSSSEGDDQ